MHATNDEINIKNMGGLHKHMKATSIIMTIASTALAGIFPLAGFFSKDLILEVAFGHHAYILWAILWITAGLTAFYSFRLIMYVFHGEENFKKFGYHPHETYPFVIAAMTPLAILAIIAGWFQDSFVEMITKVLPQLEIHVDHSTLNILIAVTSAIAIAGILFAVFKHKKSGTYFSESLKNRACYKLLANQYFMPHFLEYVINRPYLAISKFAWKFIDLKIIDFIVDGIGKIVYASGKEARVIQSGNLSTLLKVMVYGLVILLVLSVALGFLK
jgi:NADH-quinone oxidoreductase subunit L